MKSRRSSDFRAAFNKLPPAVQQQARAAYVRFKDDPSYPGLHFKRVHLTAPLWSVRIGIHYRAVGVTTDIQASYLLGRDDQLISDRVKHFSAIQRFCDQVVAVRTQ